MKLTTSWTKGITEDQEKELRAEMLASPYFRKRLLELLKERDTSADKESLSKKGLDSPNWALKQAETCGYRRAINEIMGLVDLNTEG